MKRLITKLIALILVQIMLLGVVCTCAEGGYYPDIAGNWAEDTLKRAINDKLIEGSGNTINPDKPITYAELLTVLCRVFSPETPADISDVRDVCADDWFYQTAAKSVAMGFVSPKEGMLRMNAAVTRSEAFAVLAEAFQIAEAHPDLSVLSAYSDGKNLCGASLKAAAELVSGNYINGSGGCLNIDQKITRAELLTILYRIVSVYDKTANISDTVYGGAVLHGVSGVSDTAFTGNVYIACDSSSDISLNNVTAPAVVLRCDALASLSVASCAIDRLTIASRSGDISLSPDEASKIGTVAVGTGSGAVKLGGNLKIIEITGNGREVEIDGPVDKILISGGNNTIRINKDVSVNTVSVLASGCNNTVEVDGTVKVIDATGNNSVVCGTGIVETANINAAESRISVAAVRLTSNSSYGLNGVKATLLAPDLLPAGETLNAKVTFTAPQGTSKPCRINWYIDGIFRSGSDATLIPGLSSEYNYSFTYTKDMPETARLTCVLSYMTEDGDYAEISAEKNLSLENYGEDYYKQNTDRVMSLITPTYAGDNTLEWAQANDYTAEDKETWVNANGYVSSTGWLIWISIASQRVNVFNGACGNWKLYKNFIVGTGAPGNDTPTGVYKVLNKLKSGWMTSTYTVKPVVNFINTAYAFHSRLYYPGTSTISDGRIGFPVSHGCVRMYDADINWIYNNIPLNTTVVVY